MKIKLKIKESQEVPLTPEQLQVGMNVKIKRLHLWNSKLSPNQPTQGIWYYGRIEAMDAEALAVYNYGFAKYSSEVFLLLNKQYENKNKE